MLFSSKRDAKKPAKTLLNTSKPLKTPKPTFPTPKKIRGGAPAYPEPFGGPEGMNSTLGRLGLASILYRSINR